SGKSCSAADVSPCSMAERICVTSAMPPIIGRGEARRDWKPASPVIPPPDADLDSNNRSGGSNRETPFDNQRRPPARPKRQLARERIVADQLEILLGQPLRRPLGGLLLPELLRHHVDCLDEGIVVLLSRDSEGG